MSGAPADGLSSARVRDLEVAWLREGPPDAPVVLLVHGLLTDLRIWDPVAQQLSRDFSVLRYDLRGHGQTSATPPPYTMPQLAQDAVALLDALSVQRVHLVGSSLGGMLAQQVAAHHGHRLLSLTLANTGAVQLAPAAWDARMEMVGRSGVAALADATLQRWFTPGFMQQSPEAVERVRATLCRTSQQGYLGCAQAVRDLAQLDLLASIRVPTLVIAGAQDEATPPAQSAQLQAGIAGAQRVTLEAAHQSAFEQPQAFCDAWRRFVSGLTTPGAPGGL